MPWARKLYKAVQIQEQNVIIDENGNPNRVLIDHVNRVTKFKLKGMMSSPTENVETNKQTWRLKRLWKNKTVNSQPNCSPCNEGSRTMLCLPLLRTEWKGGHRKIGGQRSKAFLSNGIARENRTTRTPDWNDNPLCNHWRRTSQWRRNNRGISTGTTQCHRPS